MTTLGNDVATESAGAVDPFERVAAALRAHNIEAIVVETGDEARPVVLGLIPEGAEVHSGKSKTLEDVGLYSELVESGCYDAVRPRMFAMDRQTRRRGSASSSRRQTSCPLGNVAPKGTR